jgi:hypothetical protein
VQNIVSVTRSTEAVTVASPPPSHWGYHTPDHEEPNDPASIDIQSLFASKFAAGWENYETDTTDEPLPPLPPTETTTADGKICVKTTIVSRWKWVIKFRRLK